MVDVDVCVSNQLKEEWAWTVDVTYFLFCKLMCVSTHAQLIFNKMLT